MILRCKEKKRIDDELNKLVGCSICLLRKQNYFGLISPDFVHIKFSNNISLYVSNFMRISQKGKLLLTSCDEVFTTDFLEIKTEYTGEEINRKDNLFSANLKNSIEVLQNKHVISATMNEFGDIRIVFEDDIVLSAYTDVKLNGEYLRIIDDDIELVFSFEGGVFCCEKQ